MKWSVVLWARSNFFNHVELCRLRIHVELFIVVVPVGLVEMRWEENKITEDKCEMVRPNFLNEVNYCCVKSQGEKGKILNYVQMQMLKNYCLEYMSMK